MASRGDFHTHSTASDGRFSPTEIVDLAAGQGVRYHALTDHDSTEGIAEARKAASKHSDYTLIPGVEMGTDIEGAEVHMLGLYLFPEDDILQEKLQKLREGRPTEASPAISCTRSHSIMMPMLRSFCTMP